MTDYLIYDVFTDTPFGGNPLAVFPDATGLATNDLQTIAAEFNLSETTFVYPPEAPGCDRKVRIFTPKQELAFAGHPTIGTAIALNELGLAGDTMVLELGVGPIPVAVSGNHARFTSRVPLHTGPAPEAAVLAACVGLTATDARTDRHDPVTAGLGNNFLLLELADTDALDRAFPDTDAFRKAVSGKDAFRLSLYVYVRDGARIEARMFAPLGGVVEDPATGSAAAALAAYLGKLDGASQSFDIVQGVAMSRPSRIDAEVSVENGTPVEVAIAGRAVRVMEGRLVA